MKTQKIFWIIFLISLTTLFLRSPVLAQDTNYRLDVNRDFGYGNGADVRGNFSLKIYGDQETIRAVTFLIDGKEMANLTEPPFQLKFVTSDYPDGWHDLYAAVETTDGKNTETPVVRLNFVSAEQQSQVMKTIFLFAFVLFLILGGVGLFSQWLSMRGSNTSTPGYQRNYGLLGGTICPRCNRPFPIHFWSMRLVVVRLDRCDHCGKWSLVRRYNLELLRAAEQAEADALNVEPQNPAQNEEEKLRKQLDESKYSK